MDGAQRAEVKRFPLPDGSTVSFALHDGDVLRIVGPNGSGKTSLLRALAGLSAPIRPESCTTAGAAFVPQAARDALIGLTVAGEFRLRDVPLPSALTAMAHRDVATLSHGEARQVALACARTTVLLLDEPIEGLDAAARDRLERRIRGHHGAVVLVDHGDAFAHVATRTISLGGAESPSFPPVDATDGKQVAVASWSETPGDKTLRFPAMTLGPGLHVVSGPNGCGKSTWLRGLARNPENHDAARVRWLPDRAADVLDQPTMRAQLSNRDIAEWSLARLAERHPLACSGGEQQRAALATVMGTRADMYLLDEPEIHLDADGRHQLMRAIRQRALEGACILVASHDPAIQHAATTTIGLEAQ